MPPPVSGFWLDLSRLGELVDLAGWVAAIVAGLVVVGVSGWRLARPLRRPLRAWLRWHTHRRVAQRFATDVAAGHLDAAERSAARVLGRPIS